MKVIGNGIWPQYFDSPFANRGLVNAQTTVVRFQSQLEVLPIIHRGQGCDQRLAYSPCWNIKAWPYACPFQEYNDTWYWEQRSKAHDIVQKYISVRPEYWAKVDSVLAKTKTTSSKGNLVLGMHLRGSDKGAKRRQVAPAEFLPYALAFLAAVPDGAIFVATDDKNYAEQVTTKWPANVSAAIVRQADVIVSSNKSSTFDMHASKRHRINSEVLVDILAMSRCDALIHSASAVSESAIYFNLVLHHTSVNLEYGVNTRKFSPESFKTRLRHLVERTKQVNK